MAQQKPPHPPKAFGDFQKRYPKIARAWDTLREAETEGPLDAKTRRLLKLAVSIGLRAEGSTHSAARKALAAGASPDEIRHVVAVCASVIGLPNAVASFTWIEDVLSPGEDERSGS